MCFLFWRESARLRVSNSNCFTIALYKEIHTNKRTLRANFILSKSNRSSNSKILKNGMCCAPKAGKKDTYANPTHITPKPHIKIGIADFALKLQYFHTFKAAIIMQSNKLQFPFRLWACYVKILTYIYFIFFFL